jgi:osmoprotectant transport system ATP-binding protein
MTAFLDIAGLTRRHGGRPALDDVSLAVAEGEFVALVGPSGSGKTTLLKSINRLVEPDCGTVRVGGEDVRERPVHDLRRGIGYVIQAIGLFPHLNVSENVAIVPRLGGGTADVGALLELVALDGDMANRYPRELSGGQQQRVGVARALAAAPKLMLMDEPFGALDPVTRDTLGRSYRALHDRLGLTTLMVTHDIAEALLLADRIVVLIEGRIRADAAPGALIRHEDSEVRAMVDVPRRQAERMAAL